MPKGSTWPSKPRRARCSQTRKVSSSRLATTRIKVPDPCFSATCSDPTRASPLCRALALQVLRRVRREASASARVVARTDCAVGPHLWPPTSRRDKLWLQPPQRLEQQRPATCADGQAAAKISPLTAACASVDTRRRPIGLSVVKRVRADAARVSGAVERARCAIGCAVVRRRRAFSGEACR